MSEDPRGGQAVGQDLRRRAYESWSGAVTLDSLGNRIEPEPPTPTQVTEMAAAELSVVRQLLSNGVSSLNISVHTDVAKAMQEQLSEDERRRVQFNGLTPADAVAAS